MPTQDNATGEDKITLLIGGKKHSDWSSYRIDSDFLKPADGWQLQLGLPDKVFPAEVVRGAVVQLQVSNKAIQSGRGVTILSGRIDEVRRTVSRLNYSLALAGRDGAAILVDCAAKVFSCNQLTLDEVIEKIVRPLGVKNIRVQADSAPRNDKVTINPGMRAWDALQKAAAGRGLWPWFEPDGTLVVGGPDYSTPPVATLVVRNDGTGNNVMELVDVRSIQGCFSELTVMGQGHARKSDSNPSLAPLPVITDIWNDDGSLRLQDEESTDNGQTGHHNFESVATDPTVPYYRPQIVTVGDADNQQQMDYRAKKAMSDARLSGMDILAMVEGHRTADGLLWAPGQRVRIISEPHGTDGIYFLMGRSFSGGRNGKSNQLTQLRFKEDGVWIPDAFPKEKKGRHHKKNKNDVRVIDVGTP